MVLVSDGRRPTMGLEVVMGGGDVGRPVVPEPSLEEGGSRGSGSAGLYEAPRNSRIARYSWHPRTKWVAGCVEAERITIKNAGMEVWDTEGPNPVRLGIHFGSDSDVPRDGWETDQRFDLGHDVAPGGYVTLAVLVVAPTRFERYVLRCRMVVEGTAWFDQIEKTAVVVEPGEAAPPATPANVRVPQGTLAAAYGPNPSHAPTTWQPRQIQVYGISVTNTGTRIWNATGANPLRLGVHFGRAGDAPHDGWATDQRFALPGDLAPGRTVGLLVGVIAPAVPGAYVLRHRLVQEGTAWFDQIEKTAVVVEPGKGQASRLPELSR
jgi:hypothetical protein